MRYNRVKLMFLHWNQINAIKRIGMKLKFSVHLMVFFPSYLIADQELCRKFIAATLSVFKEARLFAMV